MRSRLLCLMSIAICLPTGELAADFPSFRGHKGWGITGPQNLPSSWSESQNVAWKVEVPGAGWSQPVVIGQQLFVTLASAEKDLRPKNFEDGVKTPQSMGITMFVKPPDVPIEWQVACFSTGDGSLQWQTTVQRDKPKFAIHPSNSYATESPVADENGIYAYFGACGVVAGLGLDGRELWKRDVGAFKTSNSFGTGSSLAIYSGKIYLQNFSEESADILCLDAKTGQTLWSAARDSNSSAWSTPLVWENDQRTEIIVSGNQQVDSYDPVSGTPLWTVSRVKAATACSPCADAKRLYFGGSDPFSKGPLFAMYPGAAGDVSPSKQNGMFESCAWMEMRAGPGMASPVSSGELLYTVDKNILKCYEATSGKLVYQNRLPKMGMVAASPLIVGDQLLMIDERGESCLVAVGREFKVISTGSLSDTFWATPAVANDSIYFRGVQGLYCVRKTAE
jgi:outer membrane protein assembly factor BamB